MGGNNLSFSITARNAATSALNSLQNQVSSLKNGIKNIGNNANAANNYLNSLNRTTTSASKGFGTLGSAITKTIGIFGGFKIVNTVFNGIVSNIDRAIQRLDTMDLFEQKMSFITGSTEQATQALENLKKSTKGTPYALDIAARGVQNFVTRGMKTKDAVDSINIWMDAVSAYGKGTNEQFESVTDAISKMRTKGTVEMRYLNRLFAAGINPVKMYAQATGMASEEVQEKLSAKEIKADDFLNVVEEAMRNGTNGVKKVAGMAKGLATTWAATTANMGIAIARGIVEVVNGLDKVAMLFNDKGLKGLVAGYGNAMETMLTGVGSTLGTIGNVLKKGYDQMKNEQKAYFDFTEKQVQQNSEKTAAHYNSAGVRFRDGFFNSFAPYLTQAILKFEALRGVWSKVSESFSAGIAKISQPLGRLVGTYLGETVTGIEDIGIAFGNWLNLRLPSFFDKLERILNWFIEHKDGVINSAKMIIKALMGFTVLNTIQNVLIGFNDKLKALNNTLAFFTLGKVQIPTLENLVLNNSGGNLTKQFKDISKINQLSEDTKNKSLSTIALPSITPTKTAKVKNKVGADVSGSYSYPTKYNVKSISNWKKTLANDKKVGQQSLLQYRVASMDKNKKIYARDVVSSTRKQNAEYSDIGLRGLLYRQAQNKALGKNFSSVDLSNDRTASSMESVIESRLKTNKGLEKAESKLAQYYTKVDLSGKPRVGGTSTSAVPVTGIDRVIQWMGDSFRNSGQAVKNSKSSLMKPVEYVKNSAVATGRGAKEVATETGLLLGQGLLSGKNKAKSSTSNAINDVVGGFEKFGQVKVSDIADDFKDLGQATKNATKSTGSGIGNFFGTMFSGFTNLKSNDKLPKTDVKGFFKRLNTDKNGESILTKKVLKDAAMAPVNMTKATGKGLGKAGKSLGSGAGNFFGTMFSGFKGLGSGQSAKVAMSGTEEAVESTGALAGVVAKLSTAFQGAVSWVTSFVATIGGAVTAIGLVVVAVGALTAGLGLLNPGNKISDGINKFFESFGEWCKTVANNAPILIQNFVTKLQEGLPQLTSQGVNLLLSIVNGILTGIPQVLMVGGSILISLISGIAQVLPDLVYQGFSAIGQFIAGIISNLPNILKAGWDLIVTLAKGIAYNLPIIVASAIRMIGSFIMGIGSMVGQVWNALVNLIKDSWNYVTTHPQEIWDAITGTVMSILDAFNRGLWQAADSLGIGGFFEHVLGLQRPEAEQGGADTAQAAVDKANERFSTSALDLKNLIKPDNVAEAQGQAAQAGTDVAAGMADAIDVELAQEQIDAGTVGADTAAAYTDNLASGITAGGESVDTALSSVGAEGLANLQVNFNSEQIAQAGASFMTNLNNALNANAFIVYQSIAVFTNNCLTQLQAGLNNPERAVPQTIADSLVSLLAGITQQVIDYCAQINTKLTDCYNQLLTLIDTTLGSFADKHTTTLNSIFPQFQNTISANLDDALQKYENFSQSVHKKLDDLNTYHFTIGQDMMTSLKSGLESTMPQVETVESTLVQKLKDTFEKGMGIHSPADKWIWYGQMLIAGLIEGMQDDKVQSFINNMINDMNTSFKNGNFNADQTVNFLSEQGTLDLIGKVTGLDMGSMTDTIAYPLAGTKGEITSYFGNRESPGGIGSTNHQGMDLATATGTPILSALAGTVSIADWYGGYGQAVVVDSGNGLEIVYGHMSQIGATVGQAVQKGQQIGLVGSTGNSTGPHLHFEMRQNGTAIDPLPFLGGAQVAAGNTLAAVLQNAYNKKYHPELLASMASSNNGNVNWDSNSGAGQWANLVLQALKMLGQPASLLGAVLATLQKESSGNPNAINLSDINATLYGTPSKGLMQVIDPTFQAYALPGYNTNIWDPLSNILASLNYQLHTYGGIYAHLNGYAVGTRNVPQDMLAQIHKGEAIIPASQNPYSSSGGDYLADLFNNAIGNTGINDLNFDLSSIEGGSSSGNNVNNNFNNVFNIHNNSDVDADRNLSNMEAALHRMLQDGMRSSSSR